MGSEAEATDGSRAPARVSWAKFKLKKKNVAGNYLCGIGIRRRSVAEKTIFYIKSLVKLFDF